MGGSLLSLFSVSVYDLFVCHVLFLFDLYIHISNLECV